MGAIAPTAPLPTAPAASTSSDGLPSIAQYYVAQAVDPTSMCTYYYT